tara:strand:- start:899 stop:1126 length:228 start_codon:yes stop_codon:yes gene_type:complete
MSYKEIRLGHIDTVQGHCPECEQQALLVAIVSDFYKCTLCGGETRQYVNGSIQYLKLNEADRLFVQKQKEVQKDG